MRLIVRVRYSSSPSPPTWSTASTISLVVDPTNGSAPTTPSTANWVVEAVRHGYSDNAIHRPAETSFSHNGSLPTNASSSTLEDRAEDCRHMHRQERSSHHCRSSDGSADNGCHKTSWSNRRRSSNKSCRRRPTASIPWSLAATYLYGPHNRSRPSLRRMWCAMDCGSTTR